jgi:SAM-dependent methyltransferase
MSTQGTPNADPLKQFKDMQKQGWVHFGPLEALTIPQSARLVRHAGVRAGQRVLDVGCGTGVVAVTAARRGALVTGLDLTPALLEQARENSRIAGVTVEWLEGDVEGLPFEDAAFDVVLSQFGHMFAPRPEVAVAEMLRVLKPGGMIAFSTWPPELYVGRTFALVGRYLPPPPGIASPSLWGDPAIVTERLGYRVKDVFFARACMEVPVLSPQHHRVRVERTLGPMVRLVEMLSASDPGRLAQVRSEFEALTAEYVDENVLRQDYLLTRAVKI